MPYVCESCDGTIAAGGEGFYFELEVPDPDGDGTVGARARLYRQCMRSLTSAPAARRVLDAQDVPNPTLAESGPARAADSLCEVTLAIEAVDYNKVREPDLGALMDAWATLHEMTLNYRRDQRSPSRSR